MKKGLFFLCVILFSTNTFALDNGLYLGLKAGSLEIDVSEVDGETARGFVIGYQWDGVAVEFEANDADLEFDISGMIVDANLKTKAVYAVARTEGPVYFKAKVGYLKEEISNSFMKESETGLSAGIGVGGRFGPVSIETEFTFIEEDIDLLSLGAHFHF